MKMNSIDGAIITLCALTYRRPVGVAQMLDGLGRLTFEGPAPDLRIVIVDNDPEGGSRDVVEQCARSIAWPVSYHVEPQRGITHARNRALAEVGGGEWIGFIDDDEIPAPDWLDRLLRVQRDHDADVVAGPVISVLPLSAPHWIRCGGFFNQMRYATGTKLPYCFTNNVIFRVRILREPGLRFDHRFALTGGEDRHFFQCVAKAGYRIVWADEACVFETVPDSRANARWILKRSYRCGNTIIATDLAQEKSLKTRAALFVRAGLSMAVGSFFLIVTLPMGRRHSLRHLQDVCWGAGMFSGLFGSRYAEYQTIHGQ